MKLRTLTYFCVNGSNAQGKNKVEGHPIAVIKRCSMCNISANVLAKKLPALWENNILKLLFITDNKYRKIRKLLFFRLCKRKM